MLRSLFLIFSFIFAFLPFVAKAETVPTFAIEQCRKAVAQMNPVKITYNYGELIFDANKSLAEISKICGNNAAGCFLSVNKGCSKKLSTKSIKASGYNCHYTAAELNCDFSGSRLYITSDYKGCNARAVLRHELQHFMNWKTAKENLLKDLKKKLTAFAVNNSTVCKDECYHNADKNFLEYEQIIENKWLVICQANDHRLDEVDHDYAKQVNYTVCAPYSLELGLN